jgi:hypothetical protein
MSNSKNNREQDKVLIDVMHPNQSNPGAAKPEDFKVITPAEAARMDVPGHGQCGDSRAEYNRLEKEADGKSKLNLPRPERNDVNNRNPRARISAGTRLAKTNNCARA